MHRHRYLRSQLYAARDLHDFDGDEGGALSDPASDASPTGGYEAHFVEPLDKKLECPVCMCALRDPVQTGCGHRFCRTCIEQLTKRSTKHQCPLDKQTLRFGEIYPDRWCAREVLTLDVYCNYREDGCQWKSVLKDLEEHLKDNCEFGEALCSHQGCNVKLRKKLLEKHEQEDCEHRIINCTHCGAAKKKMNMHAHLQEDCKKFPELCPNADKGCIMVVPRGEMDRHIREECNAITLVCPYALEGCVWQGTRQDFQVHNTEHQIKHVSMAGEQLKTHTSLFAEIQDDLRHVQSQLHEVVEETGSVQLVNRKISDTMGKVEILGQNVDRLQSTYADCQRRLESQEQKTRNLEKYLLALVKEVEKGGSPLPALSSPLSASLLSNPPVSRPSASSPRTSAPPSASVNGSLMWKISNFIQVRADAAAGHKLSLYSDPFYSSPGGYKMRLRLYPNGDGLGRGHHLSLFFTLVRGEHDDNLSWPFQKKVTFWLMDQTGQHRHIIESFNPDRTSSSFQKPQTEVNVASGCPMFASIDRLGTNSPFVRNDSILIKCSVDSHSY